MLSANDIYFLLEQAVNLGSFVYRNYEPEELDEAVNSTVFKLVNTAIDKLGSLSEKPEDKLTEIEELLLRSLTKQYSQTPIDNEVALPSDYMKSLQTSTNVIRADCCYKRANSIVEGNTYLCISAVLYDGKWYRKDEYFIGGANSAFYGIVHEVTVKKQNAIMLDSSVYNSFPASLTATYFTIVGNTIELKSRSKITSFHLNYISTLTADFKMDWCNDKHTLGFPENIQRWIIDNTAIRLAIQNQEDQQKIVNMKSE